MRLLFGLLCTALAIIAGYSVTVLSAPTFALLIIGGIAVSLAMIGMVLLTGWQREQDEEGQWRR